MDRKKKDLRVFDLLHLKMKFFLCTWKGEGIVYLYALGIISQRLVKSKGKLVWVQESARVGKPSLLPVPKTTPCPPQEKAVLGEEPADLALHSWGGLSESRATGAQWMRRKRKRPLLNEGEDFPQVGRQMLHFWACSGGGARGREPG